MIEVVLVVVIIVLLGYMAWDRYEVKKERDKWVKAILAKNAEDMVHMEVVDKLPNNPKPAIQDEVPVENLTDAEFDAQIKKVVENEQRS